jgi:DNA-binding transcriptional MocR family regulator
MKPLRKREVSDRDIRHYIYATFAATSRPPTTSETADNFGISVAAVESAYERLAAAHHIVLAPGSHGIWMSHPFSGIPTNYVTEAEHRRYYGN